MLAATASRRLAVAARSIAHARAASTLVLAEHDNTNVSNGTLSAVTAAKKFGAPVTVLVAGKGCGAAAKAASAIDGVSKVLVADDAVFEGGVAETISKLIVDVAGKGGYDAVVGPSSHYVRNVLPRAAAKLDVAPLSDVTAVLDGGKAFERPMYAGNAIAKLTSTDSVKVLTVRTTSFEKAKPTGGAAAVEAAPVPAPAAGPSKVTGEEKTKSERPDLGAASIVVSGGRALKSAENFKILYDLADKLGAAVGASRAAVDAGYVPNDMQIGQTGRVVAPNLYIAVGISGAIQHLAGMKDSKTIVAINKDPEAPIYQVADYGLAADLFTAVPELTAKVPAKSA